MQTSKTHKILAVDDQLDNLITIKAILKSRLPNSIIYTALSGAEGIELAKKELPDVVLLDIIMPTMDGYEVCRQLKADEQVKHIPVVMVTAIRTDVQSRVRALDLGADAFLSKPIDAIELIAQVNVMLRIKEAEDQLRADKKLLEDRVEEQDFELKMSEEKYKALYDNAPLPYQSLDEDGNIEDVNPEWLVLLGYTRQEVVGKWYGDLLHPESREIFNTDFPILKTCGMVQDVSFKIRNKQGNFIDISLNGTSGYSPDGSFHKTYCVFRDITEQKKALEQLTSSEAQKRIILETTLEGFWIVDLQGNFVDVNEAYCQLTGYTKEELLKMKVADLEVIDDLEHVKQRIEFVKEHRTERFESMHRCKNGEILHLEISINYLEKDEVLFVFIHDITEHIQSEENLKESERNFRLVFENSPIGIYMASKDGAILDANQALLSILGSPSIELTKKINVLKFPPLVENGYAAKFSSCVQSGSIIEFEMPYKSKWEKSSYLRSFLVPLKNTDGEISKVYTLIEDISERKRAEKVQQILYNISNAVLATQNLEELIELIQKELGLLFDTTNFYLALYDEQTNSLSLPFYKDSFDHFDSFPAEKTITHYVIKQQKSLLADTKIIRALEDSGEVGRFGTDCLIWLGVPLKVNEKIIGALAVQSYTDELAFTESDQKMLEFISDQISVAIYRKKAEEDLKEAKEKAEESDRLKSAFLANMSHEIRTPMNGILGFSDLLKQPGLSGEEQRTFIDVIERAGQRMLNIINDIIDISKIESGEMSAVNSKVNINDQLNFIFDFFKTESSKKGIELRMNHPLSNDEATIFVDGDKLYAVLMNLTKNASKYTRHGSIEIGYSLKEPSKEFLEFYVKDTGIGIQNERQDAIFERFIQADINDKMALQGAGLGLAISKAFVEMMGGKIGVESEFGKGSTFYFTIPYQQVKA